MCEFVCVPFKSSLYFPQPSDSPTNKPHWFSKSNILEVHLVQEPWTGETDVGLTPFLFEGTSAFVIILPFEGHLCRGIVFDYSRVSR